MPPTRMPRSIVLIRSNEYDAETRLAERSVHESGWPVAIVADVTERELHIDPASIKLSLTQSVVSDLELHQAYDMGWRCGDYGFYIALKHLEEFDYYWLLEPDVYFSGRSYAELFGHYDRHSDADALMTFLRPAEQHWFWRPSMEPFAEDIWRCMFPLVRLSRRAVRFLYQQRRLHSWLHDHAGNSRFTDAGWPNDEAFVATELAVGGFKCSDLTEIWPTLYSTSTFSFDAPFARTERQKDVDSSKLFHPVLGGAKFERKLRFLFRSAVDAKQNPDYFRWLLGPATIDRIRQECSDALATQMERDVAQAILEAEARSSSR